MATATQGNYAANLSPQNTTRIKAQSYDLTAVSLKSAITPSYRIALAVEIFDCGKACGELNIY